MNPLNPYLYDQLRREIGPVRISNDGVHMQTTYRPDWTYRQGRLRADIIDWGETYNVSCPFCSDTRQRLAINHRWAMRDRTTRDDNLCFCNCYNEGCLKTRQKQKELHALVFPEGNWADKVEVPVKPVKVTTTAPVGPVTLPPGTLLDKLPSNHDAVQYVLDRGFSPEHLAQDYGVRYCDQCLDSKPRLLEPRLIIPITWLRVASLGSPSQAPEVRLAGWQARVLGTETSTPKYLTAAGMKKSALLYGLPQAIKATGPIVIVEGITDVWTVGNNAVAVLGKTISVEQTKLIVRHCRGRPVIVWLDSDAEADAKKMRDTVRLNRIAAGDGALVVIAQTPAGRDDPGDCSHQEVIDAIAMALAGVTAPP